MDDNSIFKGIRQSAFQTWAQESSRDCQLVNDDMTRSWECKWQDRATLQLKYEHISIFCSVGEWANNISDLLQEDRYDHYNLLEPEHCLALFRYYTRLLLVVSELLVDFEDMAAYMVKSTETKIKRNALSKNPGEVDTLMKFINHVCKHKSKAIHSCNHHLPIWFEDCEAAVWFVQPISLKNLDFTQPDGILMPRINYLIQIVLNGYICLDQLFDQEPDGFKTLCNEYNGVSLLA